MHDLSLLWAYHCNLLSARVNDKRTDYKRSLIIDGKISIKPSYMHHVVSDFLYSYAITIFCHAQQNRDFTSPLNSCTTIFQLY